MKSRKLNKNEHEKTKLLWKEVFEEETPEFLEYYYNNITNKNQIHVMEEDNAIQSMIHLNPYIVAIEKKEYLIHYIVGVSTRNTYRKRGYMARLIKDSLQGMYENKEPFTFLMPVAEAIYAPYDFVTVMNQEHFAYQGPLDSEGLPIIEGYDVAYAKKSDCPKLAILGQTLINENYYISTKRDSSYYEQIIKEQASQNGGIALLKRKGEIKGYFFVANEGYLQIREPMIKDSTIEIMDLLQLEKKAAPKIMIRIVNILELLKVLGDTSRIGDCIEIEDKILTENTGIYKKSTVKSGITWEKISEVVQGERAISMSDLVLQLFPNPSEILLNEIV